MKKNKRNSGYVIVISLVIATAVLLLLGVFLGSIVVERKNVERSYRSARALNLAEAGVEKGIWELNNNPTPAGTGQVPAISGVGYSQYTITVSENSALIQATGYSPEVAIAAQVQRSLEVTLVTTTVFDMPVFTGANSGTTITVGDEATIDGDMGTNSTSTSPRAVIVGEEGSIDGDIYIGEGGDTDGAISIGEDATVGDKLTLDETRELPPVVPPSIPPDLDYQEDLEVGEEEDMYVHESSEFDSVSVEDEGHLTFDTNAAFIYIGGDMSVDEEATVTVDTDMTLYVTGDLTMAEESTLDIQDDYKLTVYAGGNIHIYEESTLNTTQNPLNLAIYGLDTCTSVKIEPESALYGAVYARNASINIKEETAIYGSVVGDTVEAGEEVSVHHDEALLYSTNMPDAPKIEGEYTFKFWSEK